MKTIGILGGMGPRATVVFEQMIIDRLMGGDQQLPTIITINDGSIPDRNQFLLGKGSDPVPQLQRNIEQLESMGAKIIAVPCNSASMPQIFDRLRAEAILLDLPKLVVAEAGRVGARRVCLLATEGTLNAQTYQQLCASLGIECVVLSAGLRDMVSGIINAVKCGELSVARSQSRVLARALKALKCDVIILGCTELPLVADQLVPTGVSSIDTLAILADACVQLSKGESHAKRPIYD